MNAVHLFNIIFALLFLLIVSMQALLHFSMKKSLYYYRNVSCIACILFGSVLMLSLYNYLISCLLETKQLTVYWLFHEFVNFPRKFANHYAFPILFAICFLIMISNLALIRHEGLRLKNILGLFLGMIFIGAPVCNHFIAKHIEDYFLCETSRYNTEVFWAIHIYSQLFILLMLCYMELFFVATIIMGYLAAKQMPKFDKDYIIILGCSISKTGGLLPLLKDRTNRAVRFAWQQELASKKQLKYVPSGGQGPNEVMSEGSAMEMYLLTHGVEKSEIFAEKESRSTYENFLFSKRLIDELDQDANICFATTNYHMFRSGLIARQMGIDVEGVSSRAKWYFWPNGFAREFIALVVMKKRMHIVNTIVLALICTILGIVSVYV